MCSLRLQANRFHPTPARTRLVGMLCLGLLCLSPAAHAVRLTGFTFSATLEQGSCAFTTPDSRVDFGDITQQNIALQTRSITLPLNCQNTVLHSSGPYNSSLKVSSTIAGDDGNPAHFWTRATDPGIYATLNLAASPLTGPQALSVVRDTNLLHTTEPLVTVSSSQQQALTLEVKLHHAPRAKSPSYGAFLIPVTLSLSY